ncbi:hypothetical protein HYV49_02545 [Candidatus Pacearchaeota archaeon]|nr:hypothetical protein [Candidatus Pacearchaeota archaeon]
MASEFTWRRLSEQDRNELEKRVSGILEDFGRKLDSVKEKVGEVFVEREDFVRDESPFHRASELDRTKASLVDEEFRKIFFENAPKKKGDCIVAEKGEWI